MFYIHTYTYSILGTYWVVPWPVFIVSDNLTVLPYAIKNIPLTGFLNLCWRYAHTLLNPSVTVGHLGGSQSSGKAAGSGELRHLPAMEGGEVGRGGGAQAGGPASTKCGASGEPDDSLMWGSGYRLFAVFSGWGSQSSESVGDFLKISLEDDSTS